MPGANNKKKAIQQQLQRREAEWAVNVDYLEAMIQEENLEGINLSYESLSQQKLQLDKLCDDLFKFNLTQNELKEIMERSAERSLVILKWKKYGKDHSREITTDSDSHLPEQQRRAQPHQTNTQNDESSTTLKPYYNRQKTYNLRGRSKTENRTDKVPTISDSENKKQKQSSRSPQHGQKYDDDRKQSNQLIMSATHSDTTSLEGGDSDNKDSNIQCNPNSYIEFPLRNFGYSQKQRRTDSKTNFTQIRERTLQLNDESTECTSSKMIASFPNNNGDHHIRAEQGKSNGDEDSTKSRETIEVNYKEQNVGPIAIRRDVGTTTSNDKPNIYKYAKRKQRIHQSDVSAESDCSSNQTFDTNNPDQRKTLKKTQPHQQQSRQNLHPFNRKQSSNEITPSHRINQQTTDNDSNYLQSTDDESDDHQQIDNIRLSSNTTHYELQSKRQGGRKRERKIDKIHDVNLASTNTQFQETQGQGSSNIDVHVQNQEQQFLQSIDFYQDANKINRSNQSNDRELSRKPVNNLIPETNNNLCNFNLNAQDQRLPNYINRTGQQPDRQFQHTQTTENPFLPRQAQQQPVTSSINLPKTQLKSFSGDPLRWHDWFSFFKATIHDNVTLTDAQRMTYLQNALTDSAKDSIIGYSYNGEFYYEAMQELQKRFGKPQHVTAAYLDKLEHWPRPTINNPESFVSFAAFLRQLVQTFILHNFTSDLQSSAVLKIAKDKLAPTMIIRWNEYVLRQAIVQPNLIHFKDWIDNYAEACEDLSTSQRPTNQENSSSRRSNRLFQQQSNKRCPLCGYSHNLGKCNQFLNKDINERQ